MNIVKYIDRINDLYGNESTPKRFDTTQWLASRNQPAAVLPEEFDELSPKEELYYQKPPFSTNEVFLGSKGGVSQLVDHGPEGVRQGYADKEKKPGPRPDSKRKLTISNAVEEYNT